MKVEDFLAKGGHFHPKTLCKGQWCVIHNPSDHHMRDWPKELRATALVERICEHGVSHPDPDSVAYFVRRDNRTGHFTAIHGCDGCCTYRVATQMTFDAVDVVE